MSYKAFRPRIQPMGASAWLGFLLVGLVLLSAVAGILGLVPQDPYALAVADRFQPPSAQHWLGTDNLGRDVFSRVVTGSRVALYISIAGVGGALILGIVIGTVAGYGPRWSDNLVLFASDSVRTFPTIILAMVAVSLVGPSINTIVFIVILSTMPGYARIARTQTLALRNRPFIQTERSLGARPFWIIRRHIVPNILAPLLIIACMDIPSVIAIEAGLSFLGLGIRPPTPSWGTVLQDGYAFIRDTPWLLIGASVPLIATTLGFTFVGEYLRDWLDPHSKRPGL
jgi:peptide/nickel transport system permease protein